MILIFFQSSFWFCFLPYLANRERQHLEETKQINWQGDKNGGGETIDEGAKSVTACSQCNLLSLRRNML